MTDEPTPPASPQPVIEAELVPVPQTPAPVQKRKDRTFSPVLSPKKRHGIPEAWNVSDRERKLIEMFLKTGSLRKAAQEIGLSSQGAATYFRRPHVAAYIKKMQLRSARAADLTMDKIAATLGEAIDGEDISPIQLQAAAIASKMLAPAKGPSVVINQQTNYNGVSPFTGMEPKAMLDEIKKNLLEMGHEGGGGGGGGGGGSGGSDGT